jgi:hypothetical protein
VPNSIVVSRGCPHAATLLQEAFFQGGRSSACGVDEALAESSGYRAATHFLDDHLLGDPRFAAALFDGMRDGRL